jgi:uncharacterized protein (DUF342 family)
LKLTNAKIQIVSGITDDQIKAKFQEAKTFIEQIRNEHSDQSQQLQSAIWHSAHASNQKGYAHYSKASVAFNIFPGNCRGTCQGIPVYRYYPSRDAPTHK